eukprot:COSAG01_NODE_4517_length_4960_cov_3.538984_3_plen_163_part_00
MPPSNRHVFGAAVMRTSLILLIAARLFAAFPLVKFSSPSSALPLLCDYHRRASFRAGLNRPPSPPLAVGDTCTLDFRVGWMSQIFVAGHRIRVTVACTAMPLYETGGSGISPYDAAVWHHVVHGGAEASHVLAPVIPVDDGAECVDVSASMLADLAAGVFPT